MLKKISFIPIIVLSAGIFMLCGCSHHPFAHSFHSSPEKQTEMIVKKISDKLELNGQQKAKLNQIKDEIIAKHKSKKNNIEDVFNFLQTEIKKDKLDEDILKQKLNELHSDRNEMQSFMISKFVEFHSMLTKEQKEKLANEISGLKEKFHSMD